MIRSSRFGLAAMLAAVGVTGAAFAQVSEYYVLSGDQATFTVIQNGAIVRQWSVAPGSDQYQYPLVVRDTIRTMGANEGAIGAEYSLTGADLGARYVHPAGPVRSWDGATDGTSFFTIDSGGEVWELTDTWTNPVLLFSVSGLGAVAYDPANDSIWVSQFSSTDIVEYTRAGLELRRFSTGHTQNMALAIDPADDTIWIHDRTAQGTFEQWTKDGVRLQRIAVPGMTGQNALAGEFQFNAGPKLAVSGNCPGTTTLTSTGNTPNSPVAMLYAFGEGNFTIPGGVCAGTMLGLNNTVQLGTVVNADANGVAIYSTFVPAAACGRVVVQSIDATTCAVSNVAGL